MWVLGICGSPRTKGNTERILQLSIQKLYKLNKDEIIYDEVLIYKSNLKWCKGCKVCFNDSEKRCPNQDDLFIIRKKMQEADIIIIGSYVYVEDISGGLKNWIDRMAFSCHPPFLNGKVVYLYTVSGAGASKHAIKSIKHAIISWGGTVKNNDNYRTNFKIEDRGLEKKYSSLIEKRIKNLLEMYNKNFVSLYSLIGFSIQKRYWIRKKDTIEYKYWMQMKWFEPNVIYYKPIKVNIFKRKIADLISYLIVKLI